MKKMTTPLWLLILSALCMEAVFYVPIAVSYYEIKGANLGDFLLLTGAFRLLVTVFEIPTGYLSDRWSRKRTLFVSLIIWVLSIIVLLLSVGMAPLFLSVILGALGVSFASGTIQAYLYELLKTAGRQSEDDKWQRRLFTLLLTTHTSCAFIGGWLYEQWIHAPALATAIFGLLGLICCFFLPSIPKQKQIRRDTNPFKDLAGIFHFSLKEHPRLPALILSFWPIIGFTGFLFWSLQARLLDADLDASAVGIAIGSYMLFKALLSVSLEHIRLAQHVRKAITLVLISLIIGGIMMTSSNAWIIWLGGFLCAGLPSVVLEPLGASLVNKEVEDHERSTILSIASMIHRCFGAGALILSKPLLELTTHENLILYFVIFVALFVAFPMIHIIRSKTA